MFDPHQLEVISYCIEEVGRQHDKPTYIFHMLNAWSWAYTQKELRDLTVDDIEVIGKLVKPRTNSAGFRRGKVWVGKREAPDFKLIPYMLAEFEAKLQNEKEMINWAKECAMEQNKIVNDRTGINKYNFTGGESVNIGLIDDLPSAAYFVFEHIHPFYDGNGRVGKIIYNIINDTLDKPKWPPNFWGISNP